MTEGWAYIPTRRGKSHSRHYLRNAKSLCTIWHAFKPIRFERVAIDDVENCATCRKLLAEQARVKRQLRDDADKNSAVPA